VGIVPSRIMQLKCGLALLGYGIVTILFVLASAETREWYRLKLAEALHFKEG
jgi:hypothetical protein